MCCVLRPARPVGPAAHLAKVNNPDHRGPEAWWADGHSGLCCALLLVPTETVADVNGGRRRWRRHLVPLWRAGRELALVLENLPAPSERRRGLPAPEGGESCFGGPPGPSERRPEAENDNTNAVHAERPCLGHCATSCCRRRRQLPSCRVLHKSLGTGPSFPAAAHKRRNNASLRPCSAHRCW